MSLRIVVAPSGFKESLDAGSVADCIAAGIERELPEARIRKAPLVDGGEGFAKALAAATGGSIHEVTVTGPIGQPVHSHFAFLGGRGAEEESAKTAVIEMAAAAGLRLVPRQARDPMATTTYGVGELIKAALDAGAQKILLGCGDSGTNDGGAGMAQALGVRLLDEAGNHLGRGCQLGRLASIDLSGRDPRLSKIKIDVACNWYNVLCGTNGVARVFGPQKGAGAATIAQMESALECYAEVIRRDFGMDVREMPAGGASGGAGHGFARAAGRDAASALRDRNALPEY